MELSKTEIKKLRKKQLLLINTLLIVLLSIYYFAINLTNLKMATFQLIMAIIMFINAIVLFKRRSSTRSIFLILEQVAIYEKEKMGNAWVKQRKNAWIWNLLLSGLFFFQFYQFRNNSFELEIEFLFMTGILVLFLLLFNFIMLIHFRKVDRSKSVSDFKGHTWKWMVFSLIVGVIFVFIMFAFIIFYLTVTS